MRLGMMVTIRGTQDDSVNVTAGEIEYEDNLEGLVATVNSLTNSFVVLGQVVFTDDATVIDGATLATLASLVGKVVEVSGYSNPDGSIRATRVEVKTGITDYELKGTVQNLNTANKTFTVGGLVVEYRLAQNMQISLQNGAYVEIKVPASGYDASQNRIMAMNQLRIEARMRIEERAGSADGEFANVEGVVNKFSAGTPTLFNANGIPVQTNSQTRFVSGEETDLANGILLEVEGVMSGGLLQAKVVKFKNLIKMDAYVEASDSATITEMGIVVTITDRTLLEGITITQLVFSCNN